MEMMKILIVNDALGKVNKGLEIRERPVSPNTDKRPGDMSSHSDSSESPANHRVKVKAKIKNRSTLTMLGNRKN